MQSAEFAQLVERAVLVERLLQGAPRLNLRAPQALRARTLAPLRSLASVWVFLLFGEFLPITRTTGPTFLPHRLFI